jgi:hypothetical protein
MAQNIFGDNKNLVYFGFFSIVITFASGFLGVLGLIVPVIVSAALVLLLQSCHIRLILYMYFNSFRRMGYLCRYNKHIIFFV